MSKRTELINESESNLFFIYDAADSTDKNNYILKLFIVKLDGTKHVIDILIPDIFFDIKLEDLSLIDSYNKEFKPKSYEEITKQLFDSEKKSDFLRLYYQNHKDRKKKLDLMIKKKQDLEDELYMIKLNQKGMTLNKEKYQ